MTDGTPVARVHRVEPHEYVYGGFEVMGDCGYCGHTQDDPIHGRLSVSPCFVNCGEAACRKLGCIRVYNERHRHADE